MKKSFLYITMTALSLLVMRCDDFGDINKNPNAAVTPLTSALLTNALTTVGGTTANTTSGLYAQYFSETLYTDASRYSIQDVNWSGDLAGSMYDLQQIINFNTDPKTAELVALNGSNNNQIAIARILKAYRYSVLTDRYGDMPYFGALKGETQPAFDTQEAIYTDLFKELKEAAAQFDNAGAVKGDIVYNGDNASWIRFANSLRLVLALRVSKANPSLGQANAKDVIDNLATNGGVIDENSENFRVDYPGAAFKNPWFGIGGDFAVSSTLADKVQSTGDPRQNVFGHEGFEGFPYGLQRQDAVNVSNAIDWSLILADDFRGEVGSVNVLTAADTYLARAEAAAIGWTSEDATALYRSGIQASWDQWGVTGNLNAYVANNLGGANFLETIRIQRWITFYPNAPQGWSEWRRTGLPKLNPAPQPVNTSGKIPVRFIYPTSEYNLNGANIQTALGTQGADTQDTHVWWDVD